MLFRTFALALGLTACTDYPTAVAPHGNPYEFLKPDLGAVTPGDTIDGETTTGGTTWHKDVRAIVEANCVRCHNADGVAPMSLTSFDLAQPHFTTMAAYVESGRMPPWPFDDDCHDLAFTRGLDADQKQVFADWKEAGFPIGVESDYVAPTPGPTFDPAGEVQVSMSRGAYSPTRAEARCFLLDQKVTPDATLDPRGWWVTDLRIDPGQKDLVESATLYMITSDEVAAVPSGDAGYACAFGAGTTHEVALVSWVPGAIPTSYPQESALLVPYGSRFVVRVRYNGAGTGDTTAATVWRYLGKRTPSAERAQIGMFTVSASDAASRYLPHGQSIIGVIPEMSEGGKTFLAEYVVGPVGTDTGIGTCMGESAKWDARFPESLPFAEDRTTNALMAQRARVTCTYEDGTADPRCRATFIGRFPLFDGLAASIQPLGQTCSGVEQCITSCSTQPYCLMNCIAWELPACGECARSQLFSEACTDAIAASTLFDSFAPCIYNCPMEGDFSEWLGCLFQDETCAASLNALSSALTEGIVGGACNRPDESCLFMSPQQ